MTDRLAPKPEHPRPMIVESKILGSLSVPEEAIIRFPTGLFGFPRSAQLRLPPRQPRGGRTGSNPRRTSTSPSCWSIRSSSSPGYSADLPPADVTELGSREGSGEVAVLAIVTLPGSREERPTANLQGPLALSLRSRLGKQLALEDGTYGVRCAFDLTA